VDIFPCRVEFYSVAGGAASDCSQRVSGQGLARVQRKYRCRSDGVHWPCRANRWQCAPAGRDRRTDV